MPHLRDEILLGRWLSPEADGYITVDSLAGQLLEHSSAQIAEVLIEFSTQGLLRSVVVGGEQAYVATRTAHVLRERALAAAGRRRACMINQRQFSLPDLILAVAQQGHIDNTRVPAGFWGCDTRKAFSDIEIYLSSYTPDEIKQGAEQLVQNRLLRYVKIDRSDYLGNGGSEQRSLAGVDITPNGQTLYKREVAARLGFQPDEGVLDEVVRSSIRVFYIWQSDFKTSRNHITETLRRLETDVNRLLKPLAPLVIDTATEVGDGAVRIDAALLDKIRTSDFVVADLTPVAVLNNRFYPNPNALIEVGYALAAHPPDRLILVEFARLPADVPGGPGENPQFPFDVQVVHRVRYSKPKELRRRLYAEFNVLLKRYNLLLNDTVLTYEDEDAT